MHKFHGTIFVIVSAILYGLMPIWVKLAYSTGLTSFEVIFLRSGISSVIFGLLICLKGKKFNVGKKQLRPLLVSTVSGYTATTVTLYSSYEYISSGVATSLLYLYPVLVMLAAFFIFKEKFEFFNWFALLASCAGIYLISNPGWSGFSFIGMVLAVSSAVFCTIYVLSINHPQLKELDSLVLAFYSCLVESTSSFIVMVIRGQWPIVLTQKGFAYIVLISIFCTVMALIFFINGAQSIGSTNASVVCTLEPAVSLLGGIVILNETFTWPIVMGCALIIVAVILIGWSNLKT